MSEQTVYPTGEDMLADLFAPKSTQVAALKAYLENYGPDPTGTCLRTTDSIIRELDDMTEADPETVAQAMLDHGYSIVWHPNGRHGWAMRLLV
jgi:hypothetical protein